MQFNVEISELAEEQYDNILDYLANVKKNPQAVNGVIDDFDYAVEQLENMADTSSCIWCCVFYCSSQDIE